MKAVYFSRHGGPEALQYGELPTPNFGSAEALIQVEACGLNHLDLWVRQGLGIQIPMPHVSGSDLVGRVAGKGPRVRGVKVGQRVVVAPGISCGRCAFCRAGRDSICPEFKIVGFQTQGGYAEYAVVPGRNLIPVSERLKPEQWAAVPLVFLTAWHMLITRAGLRAGETVLIHGAGSGVGSAAIQIAKCKGAAVVVTTVGADEKIKKAKALGADVVLNHQKSDFVEEVLKLTKRRGVDVVFEHVGPATWAGSVRCLAKAGRLVTCGATTGPKVELDLRFFYTKELSVAGCFMGGRRELGQVVELVSRGRLKPVVDSVFPLREAAKAQGKMESRNFFGKIVLRSGDKE